jgi:DNA primase
MHSSKESVASFTATLTKGTGGVWACRSQSCIAARRGKTGGNALDFVATMEGCSVRDAAVRIAEWFGVQSREGGREGRPESPARGKELVSKERSDRAGESGGNKPLTFALQKVDSTDPYLEERGILLDVARTFGVGLFSGRGSMHGRVVIPIHNGKGELVAYAGRSIDGTEPRYKFPAGFHKSVELFNLHRVIGETSVVLVEGFFDCMKVVQAGFPCVALMGSMMSATQEEFLRAFACVVLMLDGDEAGRSATGEIAERLSDSVFQVKIIELDDGIQPDQLSNNEIQALLHELVV